MCPSTNPGVSTVRRHPRCGTYGIIERRRGIAYVEDPAVDNKTAAAPPSYGRHDDAAVGDEQP